MEKESRLKAVRIDDHTGSDYSGAYELVVEFYAGAYFCRLTDGSSLEELVQAARAAGDVHRKAASEQRALVRDAVKDLFSLCSPDARTFQYDPRSAAVFLERWSMKAFKDMLDGYGLSKKLPMDRALQVLQEYYVVDPIMES